MSTSAIALDRFGLGARPEEPAPADPQRWLLSQLDAYEIQHALIDLLAFLDPDYVRFQRQNRGKL